MRFGKSIIQNFVEIFPKQLKNISLEEFHKYINRSERSLIRIEADEAYLCTSCTCSL